MTEQQTDGWAAVPHVETIRGTREPAAPGSVATPRPPRRRMRRRTLVGIIAGGTAVVLLAVAGIVTYTVQSSSHAPDRPVRAFLDDLTAGRVDDALETAGIEHGKDDVLLTDAAYAKASAKITGYRIAATDTSGDTAQVRAYLRQGGRDVSTVFTLDRAGTDLGIFPVWKMEAPQLGRVDVSVRGPANTALTVAGKRVTTSTDGAVSLKALPGKYPVAVDGGKWYTADQTDAVVSGFRSTASIPVSMRVTLTEAGKQSAQQAVDRWVDGCIASTEAEPPGCSFYAYGSNPSYTYTNKKWTLETRPTVSVGDWLSRGFFVTTTTYGRAKYTADFTGPDGAGTASAGPMNVNATGYITGFTDQGATFESAVGNGARDSGS